ncbi:Nucleoporin NDC1 [Phlyctochytrium bullatum]|nr:Nucleoporin NDC1 [Phlyctochytrium bullatum]
MVAATRTYGRVNDKKFLLHVVVYTVAVSSYWDIVNAIYEIIMTQPLDLAPNLVAIRVVCETLKNKKRPYDQSSKAVRSVIFNEDQSEGPQSLWSTILSESLAVVNGFSDEIEKILNKDSSKKTANLIQLADRQATLRKLGSPKKVELAKGNIYAPRKTSGFLSALSSFAEDEDLRQRKPKGPSQVDKDWQRPELPALLRYADAEKKPLPQKVTEKKNVKLLSIPGLLALWQESLQKFVSKKRMESMNAEALANLHFSEFESVVWASQSLSHFLVAAITEDKYGTVQRCVPLVLEALLQCLTITEKYIAKPPGSHAARTAIVLRKPTTLADNLRSGIYYLVTSLYNYIGRYEINPKVAEKLQRFLDFRE